MDWTENDECLQNWNFVCFNAFFLHTNRMRPDHWHIESNNNYFGCCRVMRQRSQRYRVCGSTYRNDANIKQRAQPLWNCSTPIVLRAFQPAGCCDERNASFIETLHSPTKHKTSTNVQGFTVYTQRTFDIISFDYCISFALFISHFEQSVNFGYKYAVAIHNNIYVHCTCTIHVISYITCTLIVMPLIQMVYTFSGKLKRELANKKNNKIEFAQILA